MKKILLTTGMFLFALAVNAQIGMPQSLSCTEEAFTFKANIGSGWHFSKPIMGYPEMRIHTPGFTPVQSFKPNEVTPQEQWRLPVEKLPETADLRLTISEVKQGTALLPHPGDFTLADKISYLFPYNSSFLQSTNHNNIKCYIQ